MKSIISYNVNGIRAAATKGFFTWLAQENPDIICLQEIKAQITDLDASFTQPEGYHTYWFSAQKKGYSGVAILTKQEPLHVEYGCGIEKYDFEGRVIRADFEGFSVISVYYPSGTSGDERQGVKEEFLTDFQQYINALKQTHPNLIICGDYNIANTEIDIHNPKSNQNTSGFLPHERAWLTAFWQSGFQDAFRLHHPNEQHQYSWWSYRANARVNNKGWRIDYQAIANPLVEKCTAASILMDIVHSDHCPIKVVLDL
ncbi:MAG: exodeoxyribonuclease III [Bacteroidia bacterium]